MYLYIGTLSEAGTGVSGHGTQGTGHGEIVIAHLRRLGVLNGRRNVLHHCLGGLNVLNVLERRVACLMLRCALHESASPSPPGAAFV